MLAGWDFRGARVLEVGPKYGVHSLWLSEHLTPAELVFSDFEEDRHLHERWTGRLTVPHRFVHGDLRQRTRCSTCRRSTSCSSSASSITSVPPAACLRC